MTINEAILTYRRILLDQACGDLFARRSGLPSSHPARTIAARDKVLELAAEIPAEKFTEELMAAGFLADPPADNMMRGSA